MLVRGRVDREGQRRVPPRSPRRPAPDPRRGRGAARVIEVVGNRVWTMLCSSAKSSTTEWSTSGANGPPGTAVSMTVRSAPGALQRIDDLGGGARAGQGKHGVVATADRHLRAVGPVGLAVAGPLAESGVRHRHERGGATPDDEHAAPTVGQVVRDGLVGHPPPELGLGPDLVLRQGHGGSMRVNAHFGQGRAQNGRQMRKGSRSASGRRGPCAATRASQSSQIWSTVRLAAVFGSTMAAARTSRGSPSIAARTASSAGPM